MRKGTLLIIFCFVLGMGFFSFSKAIVLFRQNVSFKEEITKELKPGIARLEVELSRAQQSLAALEQEAKVLKDELKTKNQNLGYTQALLEEKEKILDKRTEDYNRLISENSLLREKIDGFTAELVEMKQSLSSADTLKQMLRDLKKKPKKQKANIKKKNKRAVRRKIINRELKKKSIIRNNKRKGNGVEVLGEGNRGYLIKDGKNTYLPRLKIRVIPATGE